MAGGRNEGTTADGAAEAVPAVPAIVEAVRVDEGHNADVLTVLIVVLRVGLREILAEGGIDDVVLLIDAALHLRTRVAAGEESNGCRSEERGDDLGGTAHGGSSRGGRSLAPCYCKGSDRVLAADALLVIHQPTRTMPGITSKPKLEPKPARLASEVDPEMHAVVSARVMQGSGMSHPRRRDRLAAARSGVAT
jgi:hypothetical protein